MRTAIITLAVLGGLAAGFLGMKWLKDANSDTVAQLREAIASGKKMGVDMSTPEAEMAGLDKLKIGAYVLIGSLLCGLAGGVLAFQGNLKIAGPVMVGGALAPALFAPKALVFTCLLLVGGVLCLLSKSNPGAAPTAPQPQPA